VVIEETAIQFWTISPSSDNQRCTGNVWFLLKVKASAVFDIVWCPLLPVDQSKILGYVVLAIHGKNVPIYRIQRDIPISGVDYPTMIDSTPDIILSGSDDSPIISLSWSPFDGARHIAGISASGKVMIWDIESTDPPRIISNDRWMSPPSYVTFTGHRNRIAVSFRDKAVKVYDIETGTMIVEENVQRTAGAKVAAAPRIFPGFFSLQSDLVCIGELNHYTLSYLDVQEECLLVVQLCNRHRDMLWAIAICPQTGSVLSVGADGALIQSINGLVQPHNSTKEMDFAAAAIRLQLTVDKNDPDVVISTHKLAIEQLTINVSRQRAINGDAAMINWADLPMASLTCVATLNTGNNGECVALCGGQAGLLFVVPCKF